MSGFEVGEVVIYIPVRRSDGNRSPLKRGSFHRILAIEPQPNGEVFRVAACSRTIWSTSFRKLPRADADFTATIRACRPVKVGEVA